MPYIQYLPALAEVNDVLVIVPEIDMATRKFMGWNSSALMLVEDVRFLINPSENEIINLFEQYDNTNTWCMFSGINSFAMVSDCFKKSLSYHLHRGIITEPPLIYNHPLWQHALRFALKDWSYVRYLDKVFVMGDAFLSYYRFWSKRWKVIPFVYCTEWKERSSAIYAEKSDKLKVLYVGSLSHRKNVQLLFKAIAKLSLKEQQQLKLGLVGDGECMTELRALLQSEKILAEVVFYGMQPMDQVPTFMQQYDVLCLPSLHDGWGAVINEALTLGMYVICSDHCGAQYLVKRSSGKNGQIFKSNDTESLKNVLEYCLSAQKEICTTVDERIDWARHHIHGKVVAHYFIENLKI